MRISRNTGRRKRRRSSVGSGRSAAGGVAVLNQVSLGGVRRGRTSDHPRRVVGGLGVLLFAVKVATVLGALVVYGVFEHGPVEVTCVVPGIGNILTARYLPEEPRSSGRRRSDRKRT
jgi:hypothetical protein